MTGQVGMLSFTYESLPSRIVFGPGALAELEEELTRLGAERALLLTSPSKRGVAEEIADRLGPRCAGIYDPALTVSMPAAISGPSGMNAAAHCVEALYARDANPITSIMAEDGLHALAYSLPMMVERPNDLEARSEAVSQSLQEA